MIRMLLVAAVIVNSVYSANDTDGGGACAPPWVQFEDQCYTEPAYTPANFKTWSDAKDDCRNIGGDLAIVNSPHAQAFLTAAMEYEQQDVWIGLSNGQSNPNFTWTDGSSLNYTNWGREQPDGYPESTGTNPPACVVMMSIKTEAGKWNDQNCVRELPYYCQKPVDPSLTPPPSGGISLCRPDYITYFQGCFKYVSDDLNYDEAEAACAKDNTHLATIVDAYDEAFIETLMYENGHDSAWIGLRKNPEDTVYEWNDGWPVYYTTWGAGEPSGGEGEGCVEATTLGHWDDTVCTKGQPYICKYTDTSMPVPGPTSDGYCENGWIEYGSHCYLFVTHIDEVTRTWSGASVDCDTKDATLLTVHNEDENDFILRQLSKRSAAGDLTGPHVEAEGDLWLGVTRNDEGGFEYLDGEPVNYVNWGTGEPHDGQSTDCVVMQSDIVGHWATSQCGVVMKYGCKKAKLPVTPSQPKTEGTKQPTTSTLTTPSMSTTNIPGNPSVGLSAGAIAGIVIAFVVVAGSLASVVVWFIMTKRKSVPHSQFNDEAIDISGSKP
ncbi:macrophage mannose receptor 1 [Strongylocentrotus purpuratus]|uniref:C-type lectin domain-containing protein n=1 Tax=Strongylocentrotus purpuratus TaxID=7668 RepID=A0A7M7REM1_STRPU|nr:macrophage mannose receptor 1 [Strongylocentrotus purpuratus]